MSDKMEQTLYTTSKDIELLYFFRNPIKTPVYIDNVIIYNNKNKIRPFCSFVRLRLLKFIIPHSVSS